MESLFELFSMMAIPLFLFCVYVLFSFLYTVKQQTAAVIETFGKFTRVATAGLNVKIPLVQRIAGRINLRVQQLDVKVETKTKDNVFVHVVVSVQYFVIPTHIAEAFYKLNNTEEQITAFVFDVVRARVPMMDLDDVFEKKDEVADAVKDELAAMMQDFGYGIIKALVTDIEPDERVKQAMNEINAAQRGRVAASEKGEAERILVVKAAQAEAESKALQGKGIADQRRAIIEGLQESVDAFQKSVKGSSAQDVMSLVLMTQYFDTLKEVAAASKTNTILVPHSPAGMTDITEQIRNAITVGNRMSDASEE